MCTAVVLMVAYVGSLIYAFARQKDLFRPTQEAHDDSGLTPTHAVILLSIGTILTAASYKVPNFELDGYEVLTNKASVGAYRAPGAAETGGAALISGAIPPSRSDRRPRGVPARSSRRSLRR